MIMVIKKIELTNSTNLYRAKGNYTNLNGVVEKKKTFITKIWSYSWKVIFITYLFNLEWFGEIKVRPGTWWKEVNIIAMR